MIPSIPVKLIIYTFLIGLLLAAVWKYGADRQEQGYETAKAEYLESDRDWETFFSYVYRKV